MTGDVVVDVQGLRMRYGEREVLHDVALRAERGEVLCLLGPNGAGKTTTIEILEGFRIRSAGRVSVLGTDPGHGSEPWRAGVGVVLQSWRDHARWRVRELLGQLGRYYQAYAARRARTPWDVDELVTTVGLADQANQRIRTLSGGQRRRLDVAIGIVGRPDVLFLDEPTAGLDPHGRREFHQLVRAIIDQDRTTVLLTTHDLDEAEKLADRIAILDRGRVIAEGTAAELARRIAGRDEVRWTHLGRRHTEFTDDSTAFAFSLFRAHGEQIRELEVHRASLENTYLALVRTAEAAAKAGAAVPADEVSAAEHPPAQPARRRGGTR